MTVLPTQGDVGPTGLQEVTTLVSTLVTVVVAVPTLAHVNCDGQEPWMVVVNGIVTVSVGPQGV